MLIFGCIFKGNCVFRCFHQMADPLFRKWNRLTEQNSKKGKGLIMLPLEKLSQAAADALVKKGLSLDDMTIAIYLDMDINGGFGESWLVYEKKTNTLHRIRGDASTLPQKVSKQTNLDELGKLSYATRAEYFDGVELDYYSGLYIDIGVATNRLLALYHENKCPDIPEGTDNEEKKKIEKEWDKSGHAKCLANATNSRRQKFSVFLDVVKRFMNKEEITEDDQIFEQFNQKCPTCGKVYENQYRRVCMDCQKGTKMFSRLWEFLSPFKFHILFVVACMIAQSLLSLISPYISGAFLLDEIILGDGEWHSHFALFAVLFIILGINIISLVISIVQSRVNATMSTKLSTNMKQRLFDHMMGLSMSFFGKHSPGELINYVNYDAGLVQNFFIGTLPQFFINIVTLIGLSVFLFLLNWRLTLIVFIPVPIVVFMLRIVIPKINSLYYKAWKYNHQINLMLSDTFNGLRVVKAYAKEITEANRFTNLSVNHARNAINQQKIALTVFPIIGLLIGMSSQAIWGVGGLDVMGNRMTYGEFTAYLSYVGMIFGPIQFFATFTSEFTTVRSSMVRMFEILDKKSDIEERKDAIEKDVLDGAVEFKNVCFYYDSNRPILKNINMKIEPGDNVGLVGHTGCGKSTIVNLITRMYDPIDGEIFIDGINSKNLKMESIRKNVAIVSQDIFLFKGTIADNIRYARPDATMEEVIAAAKAANAHDFIMRLPAGYETEVGTGKRSLSGGERQRVAIARALLLSPSILILDEATAAMDTETERLISDALAKLVVGRTCITIAHRLSTLKDCNKLFVIEDGEIVEEGDPEEILALGGVYYKLFTLQSEAMKKVLAGM